MNIPDGGWHGIRFDQTPATNDSSKIIHCKLEYGKAFGNGNNHSGGAIYLSHFSNLCILDCNITGNHAICCGGIYCYYSNPIIKNNKIKGNFDTGIFGGGGGIYCNQSSPKILNNVISDNSCYTWGGGIGCHGSSANAYIMNNLIKNNYARAAGGGIDCIGSAPIIVNNIIAYNEVSPLGSCHTSGGGGINCCDNSHPTIINNIVAENFSGFGGGIRLKNCHSLNPIFINNTIVNNIAYDWGGGIFCYTAEPIITNTIIWGNTANNGGDQVYIFDAYYYLGFFYCNIQGGLNGFAGAGSGSNFGGIYENNIDADPLFVYPVNGDYHLTEFSPCIDTGTPDTTGLNLPPWDLDGNIRIWDGNGDSLAIIDMGCYEYGAPSYGVDDTPEYQIGFKLYQNYPNPFSNSTNISFNKPTNIREKIQIKIYNIKGQLIKQFKIKNAKTKMNIVSWNGKDENGNSLSNGIYLYRLETDNYKSKIKKMILIK
ncbi:MAG: right-handed parallel beta-helix repeat-containing protein [Candidatus Cloacimonetes bacterium]|nr:right-handed parallel beta-helix repeat-containing protein [Candidatus Cloacimonadota bacterium]